MEALQLLALLTFSVLACPLSKGGAAAQFYIPITSQRTSVDIDMICLAPREAVRNAIQEIETELNGKGELFKFRKHEPQNPKVVLKALETFYVTVPSVCDTKELYDRGGKQAVKIEFFYKEDERILQYSKIIDLIEKLEFKDMMGPERGVITNELRDALRKEYGSIEGLSDDLFRKRFERIIWELIRHVPLDEIKKMLNT